MSTVMIIDCHCQICSVQPWGVNSRTIDVCQVHPVAKSGLKSWKERPPPCHKRINTQEKQVFIEPTFVSLWREKKGKKRGLWNQISDCFFRGLLLQNIILFFLPAMKWLNIFHWKALSVHAKMERTDVSLCGSVLAEPKIVLGHTAPPPPPAPYIPRVKSGQLAGLSAWVPRTPGDRARGEQNSQFDCAAFFK